MRTLHKKPVHADYNLMHCKKREYIRCTVEYFVITDEVLFVVQLIN